MAFSFCFFFFCAYLLKRKRRGRESDETTERVTLRPGGGIWNAPLRSVERHAKQPGRCGTAICPIFASACGKIGKCWKRAICFPAFGSRGFSTAGCKTRLCRFFRVLHSFHRVFHSPLHFSTGAAVEMWEIPVSRTGFPITEKKTGCFQRSAYLADRFVDHAGDQWSPLQKDTLSVPLSDSIAAFLCRKEAQRKAIKRNAEKERGLFEKSPL